MAQPPQQQSLDLGDFFVAAEARSDRWRQLTAAGRAWESAVATGQGDDVFHEEVERLFAELRPLESYWAYPGPRLVGGAIAEAVEERRAALFATLAQRIS